MEFIYIFQDFTRTKYSFVMIMFTSDKSWWFTMLNYTPNIVDGLGFEYPLEFLILFLII